MNSTQNVCQVAVNEEIIQLVVYIPTFILGVPFNLIALFFFWFKIKRRTESVIYMSNLALADILLLLSLPFKMYYSSSRKWPFHMAFCSFVESLYFVNMYGSIFFISAISVDRYLAIIHPLRARVYRSPRNSGLVCLAIWMFIWLGSIPIYNFHDSPGSNGSIICFHKFSDKSWNFWLIAYVEFFGFVTPLAIVVFCSFSIIRKLLQKQIPVAREHQTVDSCVRIVTANLVVFIFCFAPTHLGILLQFLVRRDIIGEHLCSTRQNISLFIQTAMCLANVNCCLDAICYYFIAKEFRDQGLRTRKSLLSVFTLNETSV
uniref:G protein-coupled receptor 55 n=2 Tax=Callorhinchus milii TaxID=7868 RepID=A0A4W3HZY7_CALMI